MVVWIIIPLAIVVIIVVIIGISIAIIKKRRKTLPKKTRNSDKGLKDWGTKNTHL